MYTVNTPTLSVQCTSLSASVNKRPDQRSSPRRINHSYPRKYVKKCVTDEVHNSFQQNTLLQNINNEVSSSCNPHPSSFSLYTKDIFLWCTLYDYDSIAPLKSFRLKPVPPSLIGKIHPNVESGFLALFA